MLGAIFALLAFNSSPSFETWIEQYNRTYNSATERDYRASVYEQNVHRIDSHNRGDYPWSMAVNRFADWTPAEFKTWVHRSGGYHYNASVASPWGEHQVTYDALPASVDWTTKGAVTPVKNQQQCGSCWSFSATGSMEGAWFLKNGTLVSLSEQQLVDCSTTEGNQGCNGGLMDYAFQYVIDNKGITGESVYPYIATGPNTCQSTGKPVYARLGGFKDVPANSETALLSAIAQQPVSVAVEADQDSFQFYSSGIMTAACGTNLDHGVLAVGYGTQGALDYYKVKNSWGADWGMKGYILLGRGSKFGAAGQCGIQMDPSYPVAA